VFSQLPE
ncbi:hypothetical protein AB1N83_011594, partial [Pleurotus pulmonarius]